MFDTTQRRLFILYALDRANRKLNASAISDILISSAPLNWFDLQTEIISLKKDGLVTDEDQIALTNKGKDVVKVYKKKIPEIIQNNINEYIKLHEEELFGESQVISNLREEKDGYAVALKLIDSQMTLIDLNLMIPDRELAEKICKKWKDGAIEYYQLIIDVLS